MGILDLSLEGMVGGLLGWVWMGIVEWKAGCVSEVGNEWGQPGGNQWVGVHVMKMGSVGEGCYLNLKHSSILQSVQMRSLT